MNAPEKIKYDDLRTKSGRFGEMLFIRALMKKQEELSLKDITKVLPGHDGKGQGTMDVVLTVNGVQLPFIEILNALGETLGDMDSEQIDKWVSEKMNKLNETVYEVEQTLRKSLIATLKEQFPDTSQGYA